MRYRVKQWKVFCMGSVMIEENMMGEVAESYNMMVKNMGPQYIDDEKKGGILFLKNEGRKVIFCGIKFRLFSSSMYCGPILFPIILYDYATFPIRFSSTINDPIQKKIYYFTLYLIQRNIIYTTFLIFVYQYFTPYNS